MLARIYAFFLPADPRAFGLIRNPGWNRLRATHLKKFPKCAACGTPDDPEVHHVLPFHLYPECEMDPKNLMTLCGAGARNCHLQVGHCYNWAWYNPRPRNSAAYLSTMLRGVVKERRL